MERELVPTDPKKYKMVRKLYFESFINQVLFCFYLNRFLK